MSIVKIDEIWADDLLGRKMEALFIENFVKSRIEERSIEGKTKSYVLNIDGPWGQGKSFFLERFDKQTRQNGHLTVYVNAWKDDHADDPMIAVMASVDDALKSYLSKEPVLIRLWETTKKKGMQLAIATMKSGGKKLVNKFTEDGLTELSKIISDNEGIPQSVKNVDTKQISNNIEKAIDKFIDVRAENALKNFKDTKITIETFRSSLSAFIDNLNKGKKFKSPLFILVDELDRCRPPYAIAMLERIKHFFDVDGVAFLIATDSTQLKHSIKAVYGQEFDSNRYLLRFFDRTYKFSDPTADRFIDFLFSSKPLDISKFYTPFVNLQEIFTKMVSGGVLDLSLRDINQCYDFLRTISSTWNEKVLIQSIYMIQLIINYQQGLIKEYENACNIRITPELLSQTAHVGVIVKRQSADRYGNTTSHPDVILNAIITKMYEYAAMPLDKIMRTESASAWERSLESPFNDEFSIMHNNTTRGNIFINSIFSKYYLYVQSAGRLSIRSEDA